MSPFPVWDQIPDNVTEGVRTALLTVSEGSVHDLQSPGQEYHGGRVWWSRASQFKVARKQHREHCQPLGQEPDMVPEVRLQIDLRCVLS